MLSKSWRVQFLGANRCAVRKVLPHGYRFLTAWSYGRGPASDERTMITVHKLHLADVTPAEFLPWARLTYPVFGYLVLHPDGPIVIDTGVGVGSTLIDELYSPVHHDLDSA